MAFITPKVVMSASAFYTSSFKNDARAGFSLLEIAIVLLIFGIITSLTLPLFIQNRQQGRFTLTRERQESILYSIAAHLLLRNEIPCPADPYAKSNQFGHARNSCDRPQDAVGILPFRTLGLPESQARDGFKRYFTYAIDPMVRNETASIESGQYNDVFHEFYCTRSGSYKVDSNRLIIMDSNHNSVFANYTRAPSRFETGQNKSDFVVVVLVSHGEPGHGAFMPDANTQIQIPGNCNDERTNSEVTLSFIDRPYSTNPQNPFQHIVKWVSHKNLPALYGHTPCIKTSQRQDTHHQNLEPSLREDE